MSYPSKVIIKERLEYLEKLRKNSSNPKRKQKLKGLILFKKYPDKTQQEIANKIGYCNSAFRVWLRTYKNEGLDIMLNEKPKGKPKSVISAEVHQALSDKLNDSKTPLLGYWDAVLWVEQNFGQVINYETLRQYLIRNFKTKLKMPRKSHYKKDEQAIEAFKKNFLNYFKILIYSIVLSLSL